MPLRPRVTPCALLLAAVTAALPAAAANVREDPASITITEKAFTIRIQKRGFRYAFEGPGGAAIAPAHPEWGLEFAGASAAGTKLKARGGDAVVLEVTNAQGGSAEVRIATEPHSARFSISGKTAGRIVARTGPLAPAFGLADHAAFARTTTDVTGYADEKFRAQVPPGHKRMVSNFVVFPKQGLAMVHMEKGVKIVRLTEQETAQGSADAKAMPALYYFFGTPEDIYAAYLRARNAEGYPVYMPKYEFFGVGWEAFGALGWKTNEETVTENVEKYLGLGYPLRWMVVGSGFWPNEDPAMCATTSFGFWDKVRYPDPRRFIARFKDRGLKLFLGLRISFIEDGPYSAEGVAKGYFLKENGAAKAWKIAFPKHPAYLLDGSNPAAVRWYTGLCRKWIDFGIDGFKEDLFGYGVVGMREGNIDAVNQALMDNGVYIMGRNGYLGSAADTHRIEDFNFDQNQDRGPINVLAFAYSGFPYAYPDIVGGTFGEGRKMPPLNDPRMQKYMMRVAQFDSLNPSMAMGMGPWNFGSAQVEEVMLAAARLHNRLLPYIYSAAIDAFETGFPWTMAPLPLVFPGDPDVYGRENTAVRGYQWMFGPSLLATPLYGDDYATAETRDVYLPAGRWMDYDTGEIFEGPRTLRAFALPAGKTPLFVGGKGVLVTQESPTDPLLARVFPVAPKGATYTFTHRDGTTRSRISIDVPTWEAASLAVHDAGNNAAVPFKTDEKTRAITFEITPGRDYRVSGGR